MRAKDQHNNRDADDYGRHQCAAANGAHNEQRDGCNDDTPYVGCQRFHQRVIVAARVKEAAPSDEQRPDLQACSKSKTDVGCHNGKCANDDGKCSYKIH